MIESTEQSNSTDKGYSGADRSLGGPDNSQQKTNLHVAVIGGILILNSFLAKFIFYDEASIASGVSAIAGAIILSTPIAIAAINDIARGKYYMNELVALALMAAFVMGKFQEAGVIAFFMLIAITIEERTAIGARASIEALIKLTPAIARLVNSESSAVMEVPAVKLGSNDLIRIRPGENFPADGVVEKGTSTVNQATITGESLPVDKRLGDTVFAGTANLTGVVDIRVTGVGIDTKLGRVQELIVSAQKSRPPILRLTDRYVQYYTPTIVMIAALVWFFTQDLMRVVLVLVISCPCAIVIAAPSAVIAAVAAAARLGILIKNVAHIETAAKIGTVVFDKTGTLTEGKLEVVRLQPCKGIETTDLLETAAVAESGSNHPAAHAIIRLAEETNVQYGRAENYAESAGQGITATFVNETLRAGNSEWLREQGIADGDFSAGDSTDEDLTGMSIVCISRNDTRLGWIGLQDTVRVSAAPAIEELRASASVQCCMITGDNDAAAKVVGQAVGINEIEANCLPEAKVAYIERIKAEGGTVAVVGDGVNDAPALAAGDIGIAMGAIGSDVAIDSASIALMSNDLGRIPALVLLSKETRKIIVINLLLSVAIIVAGLVFFIFGYQLMDMFAVGLKIQPSVFKAFLAAAIQIVGTLAILSNSARLMRFGESIA